MNPYPPPGYPPQTYAPAGAPNPYGPPPGYPPQPEQSVAIDPHAMAALMGQIKAAAPPTGRGRSLVHPRDVPWQPGQPGLFDGRYKVEILDMTARPTRTDGPLLKTRLLIHESNNPRVVVGEIYEHAILPQSKDAARSEMQGILQARWSALGNVGNYPEAFGVEAHSPANPCGGLLADLVVSTEPQANNPSRPFSHHRYTYTRRVAQQPAAPGWPNPYGAAAGAPYVPPPFVPGQPIGGGQ